MTITAAADGSALGNPGPAGWAWYVDATCWRAGGWPHGTNNMGELMAVLDLFRSTEHVADQHLHILCDSQYVINCVTKWMPGWKRKGWKKADGKPVLNLELLQQIDAVIKGRDYSFEWVKGHAGHDLNEAADDRARAAATAYQSGRAADAGPGFPGAGPAGRDAAGATARAARSADAPAAPIAPAARRAAAPSAPATVSAGAPGPAAVAQDDLFSSLEDVRETGAGISSVDVVATLERELLDPEVRSEPGQVAYLLHPDFREIDGRGAVHDRDGLAAAVPAGRFELLEGAELSPGMIHLTYRLAGGDGSTLCTALWQRAGERWRLRFRQETREA
jgi:ribonuclease HI